MVVVVLLLRWHTRLLRLACKIARAPSAAWTRLSAARARTAAADVGVAPRRKSPLLLLLLTLLFLLLLQQTGALLRITLLRCHLGPRQLQRLFLLPLHPLRSLLLRLHSRRLQS